VPESKVLHPSYLAANIINSRKDKDMLSAFEMKELLFSRLLDYFSKVSFQNGILTAEEPRHEGVQKYSKVYVRMQSHLQSTDIHLLDLVSRAEMLENYYTFSKNSVRIVVTNFIGPRLKKAVKRLSPPMFIVYYNGECRKYVAEKWRK